jgi:hypothetical protein
MTSDRKLQGKFPSMPRTLALVFPLLARLPTHAAFDSPLGNNKGIVYSIPWGMGAFDRPA